MKTSYINPVPNITTADATDLATVITLTNSLKAKVDEIIRQFNLIIYTQEDQ